MSLTTPYGVILIAHVLIGACALISGCMAIVSNKGGRLHMRAGRVYYYSMFGIGISALVLCLLKWNPFLLAIALFSTYLTYSGKAAIDNWRRSEVYTPSRADKIPFYIAFITALGMIGYPIFEMLTKHILFVSILAIFGVIMLIFSIRDIVLYGNNQNFVPGNSMWQIRHIGLMGGSYIAAVTAFLLNNFHIEPYWVMWLLPAAIGGTVITFASIKRAKKLAAGNTSAA